MKPTSSAYAAHVAAVLRSGRDVLGNELLAAPGGPSYAAAHRALRPLLLARGPGGKPLTESGVYYLPFAQPAGPQGATSVALHVADGSQVVSQRVGGRSLTIDVGPGGGERYGSCLDRLGAIRLGGGYLPILQTTYADADGARYAQESFAATLPGSRSLASFVRLTVDARRAHAATEVRLRPSVRGLRRRGDLLVRGRTAYLAIGAGGRFDGSAVDYAVPRGSVRTIYAVWLDAPAAVAVDPPDEDAYRAARAAVADYWSGRLAEGAAISVPDARVENALRALRIQDLELTWRYSIGNPYEEFSFPESVDVAQVLAEHGYLAEARSILRVSLTRAPAPYANWKRGERLLASAEYVRLSGDRAYLAQATPTLRAWVSALGRQIRSGPTGLLDRERYSSDIPNAVLGLHSQAVVWAGLRAMAGVWRANGRPGLAATCTSLADRLGAGLRRAVARSTIRLPGGALFVGAQLLDGEQPYGTLTEARLGSYWNLVVPYALASGLFPPGGRDATGILRYLLAHGSRLLGLVRAGGYALYGQDPPPPTSATDEVYGINVARFLADNDQADQLVLSLYGDLGAGMTANTFVSGEAASLTPLPGTSFRAMYLPPNSASNAAFLETLRVLLVHETADGHGRPHGLQLAYATPRGWLAAGKRISVDRVPTSFGPVSFTLAAGAHRVRATVDVPPRPPAALSLRLRLPAGRRVVAATLAGRPVRVDRATGTLDLSGRHGSLDLVVRTT
ncbi:MAG TPA: hypothetical protein VHC45_10580 [Gaiellaceae bacterium]|nr:hypothetical protein [Gaiellaceae bacterium]